MSIKKPILVFIVIVLVIFFLLKAGSFKFGQKGLTQPASTSQSTPVSENEKPQIVSTSPDPLDKAIISSDQQIEITFNRGLENEGELKLRFEPEIKYKITLSQERKVAKITPEEPYELGVGYTMFITGDSKFTGYGSWGEEKSFHFQTIRYRGI